MNRFGSFLFFFLFSLQLSAQRNVRINQVGYTQGSQKIVYSIAAADSFYIIRLYDRQTVFSGKLNLQKSNDPSTLLSIYSGDFSSLLQSGLFTAKTSANDSSFYFSIESDLYNPLYFSSLKSFYYQRCGIDLLQANAGVYKHAKCHQIDGFLHSSTGFSNFIPSKKGWHDAGDFGKYIVNTGITVGTMLKGYEWFPGKYLSDNIGIPESGNGIPDLLDEVRFELEWMLTMQRDDGGVYHKLTELNFPGFIMPQNSSALRYILPVSSTATGDFAAVLASASKSFQKYDTTFANACLTASEKAWQFLDQNPTIIPSGGFKNPSGVNTGEYGDGSDSDERLWASIELYEATGKSEYLQYFEIYYANRTLFSSNFSWGDVYHFALLSALMETKRPVDTSMKTILKNALISKCNSLVQTGNNSGFNVSMQPNEYNWGSNSSVLNNAIFLICGFYLTNNTAYLNSAVAQTNYIYGSNGLNFSFVTGAGTNYPKHIHHRASEADGVIEPIPGLLAGGPNKYLNDPKMKEIFTNSTPAALCYIDHLDSYASNEVAINWNAPLVFVTGFLSDNPIAGTSVEKKISSEFSDFELTGNYPNPFNGGTQLQVRINIPENYSLRIYNNIGQLLITKNLGILKIGVQNIPIDLNANNFSSGSYFFQLANSTGSKSGRFVYAK